MEKYRILLVIGALAISVLAVTACARKPIVDSVLSGGTTDRSDPHAPKEITSKEITEFSVHFFYEDPYYEDRRGTCDYTIKNTEKDEHILHAVGFGYDITTPIAEEVLTEVQGIIDQYKLVEKNGIDRLTAGLPPEYQGWSLRVGYASGETLYFRENGGPYADWTAAYQTYFEKLLAGMGYEEVLPPKEEMVIEKASLTFDADGMIQGYNEIVGADGEKKYLRHTADDPNGEAEGIEEYALITGTYYEDLQQLFRDYDFKSLHQPETVTFNLEYTGDSFLEIYVDYENDRQIYAELTAEELPENWPELRDAYRSFIDAYIEENRVEKEVVWEK